MKKLSVVIVALTMSLLPVWAVDPPKQAQTNPCCQCATPCPTPSSVKTVVVQPKDITISEDQLARILASVKGTAAAQPQVMYMPAPAPAPAPAVQPAQPDNMQLAVQAATLSLLNKLANPPAPAAPAVAPVVSVDLGELKSRLDRSNQLQEIGNGYLHSTNLWTKIVIAPSSAITAGATTYTAVQAHGEVQQLKKLNVGMNANGTNLNNFGQSLIQTLGAGQSNIATAIAGIKPPVVNVNTQQTNSQVNNQNQVTAVRQVQTGASANSSSNPIVVATGGKGGTGVGTGGAGGQGGVGQGGAGGAGGQGGEGGAGGAGGTSTATGTGGSSTAGAGAAVGAAAGAAAGSSSSSSSTPPPPAKQQPPPPPDDYIQ